MRMQTYRRKVGALEVIIHVEKELYKYVPHVFDAIFCTFEQCYYVDSPDAIHIYSQKKILMMNINIRVFAIREIQCGYF